MSKVKKYTLLSVSAFFVFILVVIGLRKPLLERVWDEDVKVLATIGDTTKSKIEIQNIRNWKYDIEKVLNKDYFNASYSPDDIEEVWLYEQPLGMGGLVAHTFLVFQFSEPYGENRYLGISVETRRQKGEKYSLVGGLMRSFEVTHIWATENDLVTRRVNYLDYPLNRYQLKIPHEYKAAIFVSFLEETKKLGTEPTWYNTFTMNCTNSLIGYVNKIQTNAVPFHYSFIFTGKASGYLNSLGYIEQGTIHINRNYLKEHALR